MKLSTFIIIVTCLQASASGYAQKITLSEKDTPLKNILSKIEKQSGYLFWYENELLEHVPNIDLEIKNLTLNQTLDETFLNLPLKYSIVNKTIVIQQKKLQKREIRGVVKDSLGVIPGVAISVKGQPSIGTVSDQNGKYILDVPSDDVILVFSSIGYETQEVPVRGKTILNVFLKESNLGLEEVVVVAFGQQKKNEVVGSVTSIKPADLKVPSSNLTTALAGRAAGVIAYQRSGEPGQDNASFFIRGVTTFGYKQDPLILIDGVEQTTTELARLQPDDIEAFSIMKDATSTALYGARGANGVILVTTKEGKEGKATVSLRLENSISSPTKNVEFSSPVTYMQLFNESILTRDALGELRYPQQKIDNTIAGVNPYAFPATDWRDMLFNDNAVNRRANMSISGGGKSARYYVAGSYNKDNGVLKVDPRNNFNNNIDLKSYNLRSNVNVNLTKTTEMIVRLNGNFDDYSGPLDGGSALYQKITRSSPVDFPAFYPSEDSEYSFVKHTLFGNNDEGTFINPYADMVRGYKEYSRSLMLAQLEFKQDFSFLVKGLSFRTLLNTNRRSFFDVQRTYNPFYYSASSYNRISDSYNLNPINEDTGTEYLDFAEGDKIVNSTYYLEAALNYSQEFKKHGISAMLVNIQRSNIETGGGTLQTSLPSRNLGLSGRTTYSYNKKYFAEFNFGYNGSERFDSNNRFGFFPSAGVAWNLGLEKFMQPLTKVVSNLRLRGTYGLVGNDAIGSASDRFFYLSEVNMNDAARGAVFGDDLGYGRNGVSISRYSNPNISWERAKKANIAVELGLFNSVNIVAEYFTEKRDNILMSRNNIPVTTGLSAVTQANVGKASGQGFDFSLDYSRFFKNDFWIQSRINFTYATSKLLVNEEPQYENARYLSKIGYSLGQQWGYIAEHLFVDEQEVANSPLQSFGGSVPTMAGDIKYRDVNGDGQITELDKVPIGYSRTPEIVYGFGFSTGFKNFDVSAFFQGLAKESFWIGVNDTKPFVNQKQLLKAYADDHWSEDNRNIYALWPRLSSATSENNQQVSTWFMRDGAFIRLKSVELGYTLPAKLSKKIYTDKVRVYMSGTNLLTWSKFKLWDVEMAGNGLRYPIQSVYNFGINLSF